MSFHALLFQEIKKESCIQTEKKICALYGHDAVPESPVCRWFARCKVGCKDKSFELYLLTFNKILVLLIKADKIMLK